MHPVDRVGRHVAISGDSYICQRYDLRPLLLTRVGYLMLYRPISIAKVVRNRGQWRAIIKRMCLSHGSSFVSRHMSAESHVGEATINVDTTPSPCVDGLVYCIHVCRCLWVLKGARLLR